MRLNEGAVAPVCCIEPYFENVVAGFCVRIEFVFFRESLFELALFVYSHKTFKEKIENAHERLVRISRCGVKIYRLCAEVHIEHRAVLIGTFYFRATRKHRQKHREGEKRRNNLFHFSVSSEPIENCKYKRRNINL